MITLKELMKDTDFNTLPADHKVNVLEVLKRINMVRSAYGKPMSSTSFYRTMAHHIQVYKDLAKQKKIPFDINKVPMKSKHLIGAAVDIYDEKKELYNWLKAHPEILDQANLWCEEDTTQPRVHFQILPYGSYKEGKSRWFIP